MQFLDPVGIGKIVKTVEYTVPANMDPTEMDRRKKAVQAEIDGYVKDQ
jgi:hypothetical protein